MKQMKIALVAILAIVMGTTFTSCLNSDSGPSTFDATITISDIYGSINVKSDSGLELDVQNVASMQVENKDEQKFYPKRSVARFELVEGEEFVEGKTKYKVVFNGYLAIYDTGTASLEEIESLTPIAALTAAEGGLDYVTVKFDYNYEKDVDVDDFGLYLYKVESGKLYAKVVHSKDVESAEIKTGIISFEMPSKIMLLSAFEDLEFTGDAENIIEVVIVADGKNGELKLTAFKTVISR